MRGLLLCAKDVSTLRRGLEAYPATATLTSDDGGLATRAFKTNERAQVSGGIFN